MTYNILQFVGPFAPGQSVSDGDFPAGADLDRLIRLKAIELAPGQNPLDPPRVVELKQQLALARGVITSLRGELQAARAILKE
jgi:hypothetical protein